MDVFPRILVTRLALVLVLLAFTGCQHGSDSPVAAELDKQAGGSSSIDSIEDRPSETATKPPVGFQSGQRAAVALQSDDDDDSADLMSLDPREDGWQTEHLNSLAGKQLKKLGAHLQASNHKTEKLRVFAAEVQLGQIRPDSLQEIRQSKSTTISRMRTDAAVPQPTTVDADSAFERLSKSLSRRPSSSEFHSKFKVVRVTPTEGGFRTVQLVNFRAHNEEAAWEQNATWEISWSFHGKLKDPLIQSLEVTAFEEVVTAGQWFTDCTSSVLSREQQILHEQFGVGVNEWLERLDQYYLVMQFGHNGIAIGDVNGDGREDVYRAQVGGLPNRLLIAQPDGSVKDESRLARVDFLDNTRGVLLVDIDNDDDQDLVLAMHSDVVLLANDGTGRFAVRTRFPLRNVFSLAAADYDEDGDLDLYACVYYAKRTVAAEFPVPMPTYDARNGGNNVLLQNKGDWEFADVTDTVGLSADNSRFSFAAVWEDYDNDGKLDLFVANDFGHNSLYRRTDSGFQLVTEQSGTANGTFGMSISSADFNHDGWMDFYKANMYSSAGNRIATQPKFLPDADEKVKKAVLQMAVGNTLFTNAGDGTFRDESIALGVEMGRWSWGSVFFDIDNDGWEDLFVTNGFVTGREDDDL